MLYSSDDTQAQLQYRKRNRVRSVIERVRAHFYGKMVDTKLVLHFIKQHWIVCIASLAIIYSAAPIFRRLQNSLIKCLLFYWRIYDPDFLYVLTVHLLDLVNQHLIDQPVQHRLVQFLNSCVLPDFPDKGTDVAFLLLL